MRRWRVPGALLIIILVCLPEFGAAQNYGWQNVAPRITNYLYSVVFFDSLNGWTGGYYNYRTTDGGSSWAGYSLPMRTYAVTGANARTGWAVGNDGGFGRVYATNDSGVSWHMQLERWQSLYRGGSARSVTRNTSAGYYVKLDSPWVFYGLGLQTSNSGSSWTETRLDNEKLNKVVFADSMHGWITAWFAPFILRTVDGGITWSKIVLGGSLEPTALSFLDSLRGWMCRGSVGIWRTKDGGVTWDFLHWFDVRPSISIWAISFVDTLNGWGFGDTFLQGIITEVIYRTTDGGYSWYQESIGLTEDLGSLNDGQMLDLHHGWAVSDNGDVLRYGLIGSVPERLPELPGSLALRQNYPNPFNSSTMIEFELPARMEIDLTVFDILGRKVQTLASGSMEAGVYRVQFDASRVASGTYIYRLRTRDRSQSKQLILLR